MDQSSSELEQEYDLYHAYQRTTYCRKEVVESSTEKQKPISIKNDDEKGVYQNHYLRQPVPTEVQDYSPSQWHGPSCFALYECPSNVPLMLRHFIFQHWVIFVRGFDEQIPLEERCRCPMIGCQASFDLQLHLIGHIKVCKALKEGSYWCPFCRQEETIMLPTVLSDNMMAGSKVEKWHMLDSAYLSLAKFGSKARQRVSKLLAFKVRGKRWLMISKNTSGILELEAPIERYSGSEYVLPINQGYPWSELDSQWFAELDGSSCYCGPGQAIKLPFDLPVEISGSEPSFELEHPSAMPSRLEAPNLKRKHASATEASYASPVFKDSLGTNSSPLSKRFFGDFNCGQSTGTRPTSASPTSINTSPNRNNTGHDDKSSETFNSTTTSLSIAKDPISRYQQSTTDRRRPSTFSAHPESDSSLDLNDIERGRYNQQFIQQATTPQLYCNTYNPAEQLNGNPSPTSTDSSTTYFSTGSDKSCSFTVSPTSAVSDERTFYKKGPLTLDTFAIDIQKPSPNAQHSRRSTSSPDKSLRFIPSSPHSNNTSPTSSTGSQSSGSQLSGSVASDPGQCHLCSNCYAGSPRNARQNLKRHMKQKHCESPKQYPCAHCGTTFNRSDNYGNHIRGCEKKDD